MPVSLGRSHARALHHLLRNHLLEVACNATWQDIHRAFELGRVERRRLTFTPRERELLREEAKRHFGWDLIEPLPAEDRIQAATQAIDEKLAPQRPDDGFVLAKGALPAPLPALPTGCALRVALDQLEVAAIGSVLVVENLDCFDQIHRFQLPDNLGDALVLYRGHGAATRGTRQLLQRLPVSVPVVVFADYDPAGLVIAATLPQASHLLVPQLTPELLAKGSREHFQRQHLQARHLDNSALGGWQAVWAEMKLGGVSVKQQHMLAMGAPLHCIDR
ncbi:hypothetical protein [Pseudomonas flexibilis]|uniref:DUF7281 domain-containing protein n=1 Tax=Pseudomonas flexibilis TaxID=706570 RepID=A0A0B3BXV9_9PSED|nr:hypothetical protein [Pseudomonas flexibilis]KHO65906.1 hypothetical protein PT85_07700 [Pseudomonas flexibilis]SCX75285.1 hypothetical protein SAMN02927929_00060 [Pseudomonas flexibilis]